MQGPPRLFSACAAVALALLHMGADMRAVGAQAGSGAIEGRVTFTGTAPSPTMLTEDGSAQPVLYLEPSGGLRYAVVYLPDAPGSSTPVPAAVTVNQHHFVFEPQVLAVRAGQIVRFTNDDVFGPWNSGALMTDQLNDSSALNGSAGSYAVLPIDLRRRG